MNHENIKLAYGTAYSSNTNGYVGAVLITDYKGFPIEFRHTDPIIPTKIQQVLYGEGLEKYVKVDVILDSLLKILSSKISVLLVQDDDLLEYKTDNVVIIRVSSTKSPPLSQPGEISKVKTSEYLLQNSHSNNPVRLQFSTHFNCEGEQFRSIIETLTESGKFMDIDEPLNRVYKTLELVCNQEV
ncbi:MAG: hypothetical protein A2287_06730 [Candidatus Melainabacteria bacterium RIFOXYA12_FULL_32_12]|nr:MAG: hypothetical protein A2255_09170 [Candidatus Melainabacteria bacterium RIFOXYA2_FULL_32_9]OGI25908.1 MAG: hypothetical protein A2287_06730 [Candidatus Melainabacteria bacterium RIFOXYA12_FULL_32_12]